MNTNHYPNLDLCKQLTSIGFPKTECTMAHDINDIIVGQNGAWRCPSVMEMLDVMPYKIEFEGSNYFLTMTKEKNMRVSYEITSLDYLELFVGEHLPNSLAEMTLWLVKNKHLSFTKPTTGQP